MNRWSALPGMDRVFRRAERNLRALELLSRCLNEFPSFLNIKEAEQFAADCGITLEEAVPILTSAACGLSAEDPEDREIERVYFRGGIRRQDPAECAADPYYRNIRLPEVKKGGWEMGYKTLAPCELFTADDPLLLPDGTELQRIGWFAEEFRAPVVRQGGREWMTVTPSERATMLRDIEAARGNVTAFGLGLGYFAYMAARKENVNRVTVVEKDPEVIALFREYLLPQMECRNKIEIVEADAFAYAEKMDGCDFAYVDIWHDVLDGTPMYLKMKRLEKYSPQTVFTYWIEPSMLAFLRSLYLWEMHAGEGTLPPLPASVSCGEDVLEALSDERLRRLAPSIPIEAVLR